MSRNCRSRTIHTFRAIVAGLVAMAVLGICVEPHGEGAAKGRRKARARKPAQVPAIAVVGDQDPMPEYTVEDDDSAEAAAQAKTPVYRQLPTGREHSVTVTCDQPDVVQGMPLRVLYADSELKLVRLWPDKATFDAAGSCHLSLPGGTYAFEVLGDYEGNLVALRSGMRRLQAALTVPLAAAEPVEVTLLGPEGKALPLKELAVRSGSSSGEVRWQPQPGEEEEAIAAILTPGAKYRVRALGGNAESAVALWRQIDTASPQLATSRTTEGTCNFAPAADGPRAARGGTTVHFPDSNIDLELAPQARLVTNRRFATVSYWLQTEAGRKIQFHERGYRLPGPGVSLPIQLGGALQAVASGAVLLHQRPGGFQVVCEAGLRDAAGHFVIPKLSTIDFQAVLQERGQPVVASQLHGDADTLRARLPSLRAGIRYSLGGDAITEELPLAPFTEFTSAHFHTFAPPAWTWQTRRYLDQCERVYALIHDVTGRTHPKPLGIAWHTSNVSLGGPGGISMKLRGLRESFAFYHYPWAISHEIMHGFRYAHGDKMRYDHKLVMERLRAYRWQMADNPELLPSVMGGRGN